MKKKIALMMACVMAFGVAVGSTLAWLTDSTQEVKNTFTDSDINITLTESASTTPDDEDGNVDTNSYQMIPGHTITKDPKVTVLADSEACWLFVEITKSANFDSYMTYTVADGWIALGDAYPGVYYRQVDAVAAGTADENLPAFNVIKDNTVSVKTSVTKDDMDALTDATYPTLTFTAYAVQYNDSNTTNFSAENAWKKSAGYVAPTPAP